MPEHDEEEIEDDPWRNVGIACWLIGGSIFLRMIYVFLFTDYAQYIGASDMNGYWMRALNRFQGHDIGLEQWGVWPPLYHIILANAFTLMAQLEITQDRWLGCVLALQIIFGSVSVYWVYRIAAIVQRHELTALVTAIVYGLTYPIVYFNAFVLSENVAIPLLIAAVFLAVRTPDRWRPLLVSGVLLGITTGVRPAFGIFVVGFVLYFLSHSWRPIKLRPVAAFLVGFVIVIGLVCSENRRISNDDLKGLSANGGLNFFIAQGKNLPVVTNFEYHGQHFGYSFSHPQFAGENWHLPFTSHVPFHDQAYYYQLGFQELRRGNTAWIDLLELRKLVVGPFFPDFPTARGYDWFDSWSKPTLAILLVAAFVLPPILWLIRRTVISPEMLLLWSFLSLTVVVCYFYGNERRFSYSLIFAADIIVFGLIHQTIGWLRTRFRAARPDVIHEPPSTPVPPLAQ